MRITVSIVNYNTWEDTLACIESVLSCKGGASETAVEILVHDNGSTALPSITALGEHVFVHRSNRNVGFGTGHNSNFGRCKGDFFLVLNPDTRPSAEALHALADTLEARKALGAVAPQLVDQDGRIERSCRRFPTAACEISRGLLPVGLGVPGVSQIRMLEWDHRSDRLVDQPPGAALMFRREDFAALSGFDTSFPMYFEDVDLCKRTWETCGPIQFVSAIKCIHFREGTARHYRTPTTFWTEWSRQLYHRKWTSAATRMCLVSPFQAVSSLVRALGLIVLSLTTTDYSLRSGRRQKAAGYFMFLASRFYRRDGFWRSRYLW